MTSKAIKKMTNRISPNRLAGHVRQLLALALIFAICPAPALLAQASAVGQSVAATPMSLHITILDGEDALNSIRERTAREPIVQVEDENHKPVAGALLLFTINSGPEGASGSFSGISSTLSVTTGPDGRGVAHGLLPNKTPGKYTITVSATLGTLVATAIIHQSNIAGAAPGGSSSSSSVSPEQPNPNSGSIGTKTPSRLARIPKKYWAIGGGIVVVGTVLGVTLTRGSGATTITPGTGTVGP
jgi:hypothetical protein